MQISHLLMRQSQHRRTLFGGCEFVPDVASLQAWLETAWQAGFDPGGAAMFGGVVQGTRKWIGTTEAAALLRYQGCRALLVEFHGKSCCHGTAHSILHLCLRCWFMTKHILCTHSVACFPACSG
eukprot:GHUV01055410.1.p1 GENE.GHUV01055410.1~~GHUV01055410.1.p1  ORF type:complete len:124 (+),score=19.32 GHUV01055410.1:783-1154(+)